MQVSLKISNVKFHRGPLNPSVCRFDPGSVFEISGKDLAETDRSTAQDLVRASPGVLMSSPKITKCHGERIDYVAQGLVCFLWGRGGGMHSPC